MCKSQANLTRMLLMIIQGFFFNDSDTVWFRDKTKWNTKQLFNTQICPQCSVLVHCVSKLFNPCSEAKAVPCKKKRKLKKFKPKVYIIVQNYNEGIYLKKKKIVRKGNLGNLPFCILWNLQAAACSLDPLLILVLNVVSHCVSLCW